MFPIFAPPSPETIAFLSAQTDAEAQYQADILTARRMDAGQHFVALTERLREFLGGNATDDSADYNRLRLNVCHIVLSAVVDRLIVAGFASDETPAGADLARPVAAWAWQTWQANRMDAKQRRVHQTALRDSEAFVLVDWDNVAGRPRFTPHQRFVDATVDGDGDGCIAYYRNDDPDQDLLFVTKRWTQVFYSGDGARQTRQRLTVYYPDRIQKYAGFTGAWEKTVDADTEPWPIPWTDRAGRPLGIPVAHFRSSAGMEAKEAWPLQNAINKALVDLMAESDASAFRIFLAFGWKPVDRDDNPLTIAPGRWLGSEMPNARGEVIPGGDLSQFVNLIDSLIYRVASVTETPLSRFLTTKQVSSEGAQKEQSAPLINKARARQGELGNGWEDCLGIARRLFNTFGRGGLDERVILQTVWEPLEARDEAADTARAAQLDAMGLPISVIAPVLGLTPEQTEEWRAEREQRRAIAQAQFAQPAQEQGQPLQEAS